MMAGHAADQLLFRGQAGRSTGMITSRVEFTFGEGGGQRLIVLRPGGLTTCTRRKMGRPSRGWITNLFITGPRGADSRTLE